MSDRKTVLVLRSVRKQVEDVRLRAAEREIKIARRELKQAWKALDNDTSHLARGMDAVDRALQAFSDYKRGL